jgi:hypothetical protein
MRCLLYVQSTLRPRAPAAPVAARMTGQPRLRRVGPVVLSALIALGLVFVVVGNLEGSAILFAVGYGCVSLGLVALLWLRRPRQRQ